MLTIPGGPIGPGSLGAPFGRKPSLVHFNNSVGHFGAISFRSSVFDQLFIDRQILQIAEIQNVEIETANFISINCHSTYHTEFVSEMNDRNFSITFRHYAFRSIALSAII